MQVTNLYVISSVKFDHFEYRMGQDVQDELKLNADEGHRLLRKHHRHQCDSIVGENVYFHLLAVVCLPSAVLVVWGVVEFGVKVLWHLNSKIGWYYFEEYDLIDLKMVY